MSCSLAGEASLTRGSIVKAVVSFSLPLLASSILQQLYSTVDLLFVGNVLDAHAVASLGIASLLVTCVIGLFNGLSVGANVVVALAYGGGDRERAQQLGTVSLLVALIGGLLFAFVGALISPAYIVFMETPAESVAGAEQYLQTYFIAMISVSLYNMGAALCRALGDSATPLLAQMVGGLLNVVCNWLVLCVFEFGIGGVACATFVANAFACVVVFAALVRKGAVRIPGQGLLKRGWLDLKHGYAGRVTRGCLDLKHGYACRLKCGWLDLRRILSIGVPVGLQSLVITLSNVIIQRQINMLGVDAIAAFSIYFKVELPIYLAIVAIGQATTTFVAQNHGAGARERVWRGAAICQVIALVVTAGLSAVELACGSWLFGLFTNEEPVIACGLTIMGITFPFYVLYAVLEIQGGIARGFGRAVVPAAVVFVNICAVRTAVVVAATATSVAIEPIAAAYPLTWFLTAACLSVYVFALHRKSEKSGTRRMSHEDVCDFPGAPQGQRAAHDGGFAQCDEPELLLR